MSATPKKMSDLFAAAREGGAPTAADRARVRTEITAKLATAAVAGLALKGAAKTAGSSALTGKGGVSALVTKLTQLGLAAKIALAALLSGAAVAAISTHLAHDAALSRHALSPSSLAKVPGETAPSRGSAITPAAAPASAPVSAPSSEPTSVPAAPTPLPAPLVAAPRAKVVPSAVTTVTSIPDAPVASAAPPPVAAVALEEEVTLLRRGKSALEHGDPAGALAVVGEYEQRFPRGTLAEEAHVVRVLALCASGQKAEGRALATRLAGSVAAERTRAACAEP